MLLLGVVPRLAALVLAGDMVGALLTAGRVDGGQDIWLPLILIAALSAVILLGAGRWALTPAALRQPTTTPQAGRRAAVDR